MTLYDYLNHQIAMKAADPKLAARIQHIEDSVVTALQTVEYLECVHATQRLNAWDEMSEIRDAFSWGEGTLLPRGLELYLAGKLTVGGIRRMIDDCALGCKLAIS